MIVVASRGGRDSGRGGFAATEAVAVSEIGTKIAKCSRRLVLNVVKAVRYPLNLVVASRYYVGLFPSSAWQRSW